MQTVKKDRSGLYLKLIVLMAAILRVWHLSDFDIVGDPGHFSFRALGWLDYQGGGITSPIMWFDKIPWWGSLSFADHPPLVFFIQHIFFSVFGYSIFAARLPFALAGVGCVVIAYFILKKKSETAALYSAVILSVCSYAVWVSRIGFLEGIESFFIVLSLFFFLKFLELEKLGQTAWKYLIFWGAALGLALISKYSAIFLLPAAFTYILVWKRSLFKQRGLILAASATLLILLPVIIYNLMMHSTRGHFDCGISGMIGAKVADFPYSSAKSLNSSIVGNFTLIINLTKSMTNIFLAVLFMLSFIILAVKVARKKGDNIENFVFVNLLFALLMFTFTAPTDRWLSIIVPLYALTAGLGINEIFRFLADRQYSKTRISAQAIFIIILIVEFGYAFNTNILPMPLGGAGTFYGSTRWYNLGYYQLQNYIQNNIYQKLPAQKKVTVTQDMGITTDDFRGNNVIIYDDRVNWFALMFYLQPYSTFYKLPVLPISTVINERSDALSAIDNFKQMGGNKIYFITMTETARPEAYDSTKMQTQAMRDRNANFIAKLEKSLQPLSAKIDEIKDFQNNSVFKVFVLK
jgi:4-amino-4-deoxy-L-arabinose transferase-like glycosyltransferase